MDVSFELPPGYRLRAPRVDEGREIADLAAAADAAVGAAPSLGEDLLGQLWARPRFVLETDAWVVEGSGEMVGYAEVWDADPTRVSGFGFVHPDHTGRGIGTALAALVESRAAQKVSGEARLFSSVISEDEAGARLLAGRGYRWARRFWHMEAELGMSMPPPAPPADIRLRQLDPAADLPAAHRILEEAFEDHWDHSPTSYEEFLAREVHQDDFDPGLWVIAVDGGRPIGVLAGSRHADRGWILDLGVLRSHRGRGIATAMLAASFAELQRRDVRRVRLNVDSDNLTGAVALYERVGMRAVTTYDFWTCAIQGARSP